MALAAGSRLGAYEVVSLLGEGGMGQVYRAKDTRLKRDVALKILPDAFVADPDRVSRFQREAELLATLNHPNIAGIYGLEQTDGMRALVLELVEGPTLAERIAKGPMPLDEALPIAKQITEALEAAHDQGIIHRDLKPANIKVRADGGVKVLDFGLAKAFDPRPGSSDVMTNSPTLSMQATVAGVILGTAAYMSPEQASGKTVDKRTDIWSFGVVLWEMLTGKNLFAAETISHTLADVLRAPIDVGQLPPDTPPSIRDLLQRCLDRSVSTRLRDIGEARIAIRRCSDIQALVPALESRHQDRWTFVDAIRWPVTAALALGLVTVAYRHFTEVPPAAEPVRFEVLAPENVTAPNGPALSLSPDGRQLVFTATGADGATRLWIRSLNGSSVRALPGTEDTGGSGPPFWSPDGRFIAFVGGGRLKKIDSSGGPPQLVCDVSNPLSGGFWTRDNRIVFTLLQGGMQEVSAAGGTPSPITGPMNSSVGEVASPSLLPDGRHFVYQLRRAGDRSGVYVGSLNGDHTEKRLLPDQAPAMFVPSNEGGMRTRGHLLFIRNGILMAQRFDADRLELSDNPVVLADQAAVFSASVNGILAYQGGQNLFDLLWFDRSGKVVGRVGEPALHNMLTLSRDGTQLVEARGQDIWLFDLTRGASRPLTSGQVSAIFPTLNPDGSRVGFSFGGGGTYDLYAKSTSGAGAEELLFKSPESKNLNDWSRDGRYLLYAAIDPKTKSDLWVLPLEDRKPIPVARTPFFEGQGQFSPDGHWIAYVSDESGTPEIYVTFFPVTAGRGTVIISQGGGYQPRWRGDGKELFFFSGDGDLMAVSITSSESASGLFKAGIPKRLFQAPIVAGGRATNVHRWDVTSDGERFLISTVAQRNMPPISVVLNWQVDLKQ